MLDELAPQKISGIEKMIIEVKKYSRPVLSPDWKKFKDEYSSLRNSGGILYDKKTNQIILLVTARHKKDGKSRLHIAESYDGYNFRLEKEPFIDLDADSLMGVEDPRISKIGEEYYITFTAFKETDNKTYNITRIGLVKTKDFKTYTDRQIILDQYGNNKNCVIFKTPNYEGFYAIHRPFFNISREKSAACMARTMDFKKWEDLGILFKPREGMWDSARVGINTPPVKIGRKKLFMLYHGADEKNIYRLGGITLDENNPKKIIWRSKEPIISPELEWETSGGRFGAEVPNVVFTCNLIPLNKHEFLTYHSGADKYLGRAIIKTGAKPKI